MEVKFLQDVDTMNYGKRKKNEKVDVSTADGKAFIANGVAVAAGSSSKKKEDK